MASGHGVNFVELAVGSDIENLVSAAIVAVAISALGLVAASHLKAHKNPIVPDSTLTTRNFFELLSSFMVRLGDMVMGPENRKYLPFVATIFFYILSMNLFGLIPGLSMPTDSFTVNFGIALIIFSLYHVWGVREVGIVSYVKHFFGPVIFIAPLMLVIEIISHIVRPISLSLRLFGNMTGDHVVLSVFTALTENIYVPIPVIFYGLGTFVCFMQAFVFSLLSMIYIRFAVAHEGHDGDA